MDSAENGFQWENEDTPFEEKSLLIDSLPEGFKYRVKKQKILEQSKIKEELKFKVEFEVNICDKEEALKFLRSLALQMDRIALSNQVKKLKSSMHGLVRKLHQ